MSVLKEILSPILDIDDLQLDTFRFYCEVRDDEDEFIYGCEVWIYINISGKRYLIASKITENPYEGYLKPPIELENGIYELRVCIYGGEYYKNYNTTLMLHVRKTTFNRIYLSTNITLGQTINGQYTILDPDTIQNCTVEIYDPYGKQYIPHYNINWISYSAIVVEFELNLSVHYNPGTWQVWIWITDGAGVTTINKENINVSDVSLLIVVKSPENQTTYDTKSIDFQVEVYYYGVRKATGKDVIVNVIVLDMGISETLTYDNNSGYFKGTIILSGGNHTIAIIAKDERRSSKVLLLVGVPEEKTVPSYVIGPIGFGVGLIVSGVVLKKKKRRES